jgi:hypothetical protein
MIHRTISHRNHRDEDGLGLFELLVSLFLGSIILLGVILSFDLALQTTAVATRNLSSSSSGQSMLSSLETHLGNAESLGHCLSDPTGSYTTPMSECSAVGTTGTPVVSTSTDGFCFYSPANNSPSNNVGAATAPSFDCIIVDTTSGNAYLVSYPPASGTTYTTCDPSTCWPGISGAKLSTCESTINMANCGPSQTPSIGTIDLGYSYTTHAHCASGTALNGPFQYLNASGTCLSATSSSPAVALVQATIATRTPRTPTSTPDNVLRSSVAINAP